MKITLDMSKNNINDLCSFLDEYLSENEYIEERGSLVKLLTQLQDIEI